MAEFLNVERCKSVFSTSVLFSKRRISVNLLDLKKMTPSECLFAKIGIDAAEKEPSKVGYRGLRLTITLAEFRIHRPGSWGGLAETQVKATVHPQPARC